LIKVRQWRTLSLIRFVETTVFTKQVIDLLAGSTDDEYRALQAALILRPEQGAVIRGSGGPQKVRWGARGAGKRGGIRVIYYWFLPGETFLMRFAYPRMCRTT
jgi:hypothetical protein